MKSTISCCMNCQERHLACHDTCEKYLKARQEYQEQKHKIIENARKDNLADQYVKDMFRKERKNKR